MSPENSTVTPTTVYLREMRQKKQIPIGRLAERLGVNYSTLYRWETSRTRPNTLELDSWERALKAMPKTNNPNAAPRRKP